MDLKTVTINGLKCKIHVNEDGEFSSYVAGSHASASTLAELLPKLRKLAKRPKVIVAVPVSVLGRQFHTRYAQSGSWMSGYDVQHVTLVSLDANGEVRCVDDRTGERLVLSKVSGYLRSEVARRLTDDEVTEYTRLAVAERAAKDALAEFEKRVKLPDSPEALVKAAIGEKIDTPQEPAEEEADPRVAGGSR